MSRRGGLALAGILLALAVPAAQRGSVEIVEHVSVVDAAGSPVTGLRPEAFEVLVDGAPRPLLPFPIDPLPLTVVVVVDATASMPMAIGEFVVPITDRVFKRLRPGDRARVGAIAAAPALGPPAFTADARELRKALNTIIDLPTEQRYGASPVWDTLALAVAALAREGGRRAIILITDGRSTGNHILFDDVVRRARIANVTISIVGAAGPTLLAQSRTTAAAVRPDVALQRLARETGGLFVADRRARVRGAPDLDTDEILTAIVAELQHAYTLRFEAAADAQFHRLEVRVNRPGATVRGRPAFLAK